MPSHHPTLTDKPHSPNPFRRAGIWAGCLFGILIITWIFTAYFLVPDWWKLREIRHPALSNAPRVTSTASGIAGDPLNLLIIGTQEQLISSLAAAGWVPSDPVTLETSLRIVESSVFDTPYADAPVSNLFLFGRKEDLAFEKPVGHDPRQRHHVRFWLAPEKSKNGEPAWWGAATYDRSVGISHTTGQITHHIAPDIDKERDLITHDLQQAAKLRESKLEPGFQEGGGQNGGGDAWDSDGRLAVLILAD